MNFNQLASRETITKTMDALKSRNITPYFIENKTEALAKLKSMIPDGASVMTGSSATLEQIGFVEFLKSGPHKWINLKNEILAEKDPVRQLHLRRTATMADYFLGSVHALTESGQTLTASNSGSQIPAYAFCSSNLIWVVGAQKIVPTLEVGFQRIQEHVFPLEDQRMKRLGNPGSSIGMILEFEKLNSSARKIHLLLINEILGF